MRKFTTKLLLCCLLVCSLFVSQPETAKADTINGIQPILPVQYQKLLGKGMDVDWSKTKKGQETFHKTIVKDFKNAGINHVRIRVKDNVSQDLFYHLDEQIRACL